MTALGTKGECQLFSWMMTLTPTLSCVVSIQVKSRCRGFR